MAVETEADRLSMLSLSDWGSRARYRRAGRVYDIIGIYDAPFVAVGVADADVESSLPTFTVSTASMPCKVGHGDALFIDGRGYTVRGFQPDGTGMTVLRIEVDLDLDFDEPGNIETEAGDNLVTESNMYLLQEAA